MNALFLMLLALAAPHPGQQATVDVAVATVWQSPSSPRQIDSPALGNPVDLDRWNRNLASTPARAGLGGRVVTQALYGEKVVVTEVSGSWAKIVVPDQPSPLDPRGYPGWVPLRQLTAGGLAGRTRLVLTAKKGEVKIGSKVLRVSYGTRLPLVHWAGGFAYVRTPDGLGTVPRGDWHEPLAPTGSAVAAGVRKFLGLRYLWGGTSAWGFDCSGLFWDVLRAHGVTVPRDTGPQSHGGRPIRGSLQPGDLVLYGSPAEHAAIVVGGGMMVEAPDSAHSVRLVPLRPGYTFARRYTRG